LRHFPGYTGCSPQAGRALISRHHCTSCHDLDLAGRENIPHIANQREDFLVKTMRE
jgi:cytochrome c553